MLCPRVHRCVAHGLGGLGQGPGWGLPGGQGGGEDPQVGVLDLPQYDHDCVVKVEVCRLHHLGADHLLLPQPGPVHHVQALHGGDMWR